VTDRLARIFADPTRVRLLFEYGDEPTSPSRIASRLGAPVNRVSYHTHVLRRHGCLELVRTERRRGALEHFYRRVVPPVIDDGEWEQVPVALRRALVHGTLDAVRDEAKQAALAGGFDRPDAHISRIRLDLDAAALADVAAVLARTVDEIDAIQARCRARRPDVTTACELVLMHFDRASSP
jgi:DNA-binding transcriptional ArsR family regulator